ncbi:helix-turn-helix domain-containing protein [Streptomyces sp. HUCO-GS316]|uniref:helix-turn-helix domain-containing protein n=1 Tax=Streptomyces sp. HUCO-GS316 TaxID=2692198 RepID=UPI00136B8EFC|nr:helix-turn-helix domain-containing protein [Streptomyces sp. HUCO-GS316]
MLRLDTDLLREKAAEKGDLTHGEIATRAGIDRSVVTRLFSGQVPSLPNLTALAWAYGIKLDDLVPPQAESAEPVEVPA